MKKCILFLLLIGVFLPHVRAEMVIISWQGWSFRLNCADTAAEADEFKTLELLQGFLTHYDLSPWIRVKEINIHQGVPCQSNPFTINTSKNNKPLCLLATFLHEQIHRLEEVYPKRFHRAMDKVRELFPTLPKDLRHESTKAYRHFIVIFFEFDALKKLLGEKKALAVIGEKTQNRWIYKQVLENMPKLRQIYRKHGLTKKIYVNR